MSSYGMEVWEEIETNPERGSQRHACPTRCYCGLFHFPGAKTTPCYEAFRAWNELAKLGTSVVCTVSGKGVYAAAAKGTSGRALLVSNTGTEAVSVNVAGAEGRSYTLYRVDGEQDSLSSAGTWRGDEALKIPPCGFVLALDGSRLDAAESGAAAPVQSVNGLQN